MTELGILIEAKAVQFLKALFPIEVTEVGIVTDVTGSEARSAFAPSVTTGTPPKSVGKVMLVTVVGNTAELLEIERPPVTAVVVHQYESFELKLHFA